MFDKNMLHVTSFEILSRLALVKKTRTIQVQDMHKSAQTLWQTEAT